MPPPALTARPGDAQALKAVIAAAAAGAPLELRAHDGPGVALEVGGATLTEPNAIAAFVGE